jgi:Bacterial protein of unknown function (DUF961).
MKIIPEIKATFGETYFLGYTVKKGFDKVLNQTSEEIESYICKIASSALQGQIDIAVPPTVSVDEIKFNQKVILKDVIIDPYGRSSVGSTFAQVILRCTASNILADGQERVLAPKSEIHK